MDAASWGAFGAFATTAVVAQAVTPTLEPGATVERLGVAAILVVAAYALVRYFMTVVDKKDAQLQAATERFATLVEKATVAMEESVAANRETAQAMNELRRSMEKRQ